VDWLFVGTKAQDTAAAAPWLRTLAGVATKVVVLQNGIDHEVRVKPFVNGAAIVPAIVQIGGERVAPGHIVHQGGNRLIVPRGQDGGALAALFADSGIEVHETDDFLTTAWRKLLANVTANPITALTHRRQEVFADPLVRGLARDLLLETIKVGQAAGARLSPEDADRLAGRLGDRPTSGTSMLYDRLAGLPLEHEYITGAVIRAAEQHGIDVPLNRAIYALVNALSQAPPAPR
jgi:2-dehydropantoate 2-reductase